MEKALDRFGGNRSELARQMAEAGFAWDRNKASRATKGARDLKAEELIAIAKLAKLELPSPFGDGLAECVQALRDQHPELIPWIIKYIEQRLSEAEAQASGEIKNIPDRRSGNRPSDEAFDATQVFRAEQETGRSPREKKQDQKPSKPVDRK